MFLEPVYLQLAIFIFLINTVPAFMPPTWIFLAFFYSHFHLDLLPTVLIGAISATLGRVVLAIIARYYFRAFLPKFVTNNYLALGHYFKKNQHLTVPIIFLYAFFPIPSNQVFIVVGLSGLNLTLVSLSFLFGRLISYSFWVTFADHASNEITAVFSKYLPQTIPAELIGFSLVLLIGLINWAKILKVRK